MHCDMLKIQDGGAIVEKVNWLTLGVTRHECTAFDLITNLGLGSKNGTFVSVT